MGWDSSIILAGSPVGPYLGSNIVCPLEYLIVSDPNNHVYLQVVVDNPPGSKVRYPDSVVSPLRATLAVSSIVSGANFVLPSYGPLPTIRWRKYCKTPLCEAEFSSKVYTMYVLVIDGAFVGLMGLILLLATFFVFVTPILH